MTGLLCPTQVCSPIGWATFLVSGKAMKEATHFRISRFSSSYIPSPFLFNFMALGLCRTGFLKAHSTSQDLRNMWMADSWVCGLSLILSPRLHLVFMCVYAKLMVNTYDMVCFDHWLHKCQRWINTKWCHYISSWTSSWSVCLPMTLSVSRTVVFFLHFVQ